MIRVAALRGNRYVFWSLQGVNLLIVAFVFWYGLPGFEKWPIVSWLIGLLFVFRIVQNNIMRGRYARQAIEEGREEERRELARRLAGELAARRGEQASEE